MEKRQNLDKIKIISETMIMRFKEPDRPASPWSLTQEENRAGRSDLWAYGLSSVGTSTGAQTTECDGTLIGQYDCPQDYTCCCSGGY